MSRPRRIDESLRVLLVDGDARSRHQCADALRRAGHRVDVAATAAQALVASVVHPFHVLLCDLELADGSGLWLVEQVAAWPEQAAVIVLTGRPTVESAVTVLRAGAHDYVAKPVGDAEIVALVAGAAATLRTTGGVSLPPVLLGTSAAIRQLRTLIQRVAPTEARILIAGESGTGKELVARCIHARSRRARGPFVVASCAGSCHALFTSELFGHVRGAYTGASRDRSGLLSEAHRGTLFLDEVADLPMPAQPQLLRALQERTVRPLGGEYAVPCDARILCATSRDLPRLVAQGKFRTDLYHRLDVVPLEMPALRHRREDIPILATYFAASVARRHGQPPPSITDSALAWLEVQPWPGNIRQLRNVIERAVILTRDRRLGVDELASVLVPELSSAQAQTAGQPQLLTLTELEREHIRRVMRASAGNKHRAAAVLGINRTTLWRKLKAAASGARYGDAASDPGHRDGARAGAATGAPGPAAPEPAEERATGEFGEAGELPPWRYLPGS
jgi:DNA-binding NtrC family response regulator